MTYPGKISKGSLLVSDGNELNELPVGTDDFILEADSAETLGIKWAPSGGGGGDWVFISSATASTSSSIDFTNLSSTYFMYRLIIQAARPATDGAVLSLRTSSNNGSTFDSGASDYRNSGFWSTWSTQPTNYGSLTLPDMRLSTTGQGNQPNENSNFFVDIFNPSNASSFTTVQWEGMYRNTSNILYLVNGAGQRKTAAIVDAIRLFFSTGNITSGKFFLYGWSAT